VVFFSISLVITPPLVSMPSDSGRHVEQQHVLDVAREHRGLDRGADRHGLVRVHVAARLLAEQLLHRLLHLRHAGLAADQDHLGDVADLEPGVRDRGAARTQGAVDQLAHQRLQLGARQAHVEVHGLAVDLGDERLVEVGLLARGELDLGALRRGADALERDRVLAQVHAVLLLELVDDEVDEALVEVLAAQERVAVGAQHLELLLAVDLRDLDDRDVEGAAAEVVHGDLAVLAARLVEPVGERGRGRLVDDALDLEAGDAARVLGGLALGIVEVRRHRDHGLGHGLAQVRLGGLLHLHQHVRRDLRRRHLLAVRGRHPGVAVVVPDDLVGHEVDVLLHLGVRELAADQALHGRERVARIGDGLALGGLSRPAPRCPSRTRRRTAWCDRPPRSRSRAPARLPSRRRRNSSCRGRCR
jgi:hypothetical protein